MTLDTFAPIAALLMLCILAVLIYISWHLLCIRSALYVILEATEGTNGAPVPVRVVAPATDRADLTPFPTLEH